MPKKCAFCGMLFPQDGMVEKLKHMAVCPKKPAKARVRKPEDYGLKG